MNENLLWTCGTDSESLWIRVKNYISEEEKIYEFERGCHAGDAWDKFDNIQDIYHEVNDLIKYHYNKKNNKNITKESLKDKDYLINNWLWNFRYRNIYGSEKKN